MLTSERRKLEIMHLGQRHDQGELIVLHVELEQVPPPNDLQAGQYNASEVNVGDEHIAGDLTDVVEEGEVQVLVLQPGQLQVAINVGAVRVSANKIQFQLCLYYA